MSLPNQLFHFSEDPNIELFVPRPRPKRVMAGRPDTESLVWAIDEWHSPMYFFPRERPRLLLWPIESSLASDIDEWMGESPPRMVAYIEESWLDRFNECDLHRYKFNSAGFESLNDAGYYVSESIHEPTSVEHVGSLGELMGNAGVELRTVATLQEVAHAVTNTLHHSAIRSRNATEWNPPI